MLCRRASISLHLCLHQRTHSTRAPLSTLDKLRQAVAETAPPRRRRGSSQQKSQHQSVPPDLSVEAKDHLQSLGKGERRSPCRKSKANGQKQKAGSLGDVKEEDAVSVYVTDDNIHAIKFSASKASCKDSVKLFGFRQEKASETEMPGTVELSLANRFLLFIGDAASLLEKKAFKNCTSEQIQSVLHVLEDYFLSSERAFKALVKNPSILLDSDDILQQKLQLLEAFQIDKETVSHLCIRGGVLQLSLVSMQKKLGFLEELGLSVEAKNKVLSRGPNAFKLTYENLKMTLDFLSRMGVTKEGILQLMQRYPQILWVSCDNNLTARYHFFHQIGIPALKLPSIICNATRTPLDTLEAHMQSLEDLGFSRNEICQMVQKVPDLLLLKTQNLKKTLDYFVHEQRYSLADIVKQPWCLNFCLERRIIPRCTLAKEYGLYKVYSLSTILGYPESKFRKLLRE